MIIHAEVFDPLCFGVFENWNSNHRLDDYLMLITDTVRVHVYYISMLYDEWWSLEAFLCITLLEFKTMY